MYTFWRDDLADQNKNKKHNHQFTFLDQIILSDSENQKKLEGTEKTRKVSKGAMQSIAVHHHYNHHHHYHHYHHHHHLILKTDIYVLNQRQQWDSLDCQL